MSTSTAMSRYFFIAGEQFAPFKRADAGWLVVSNYDSYEKEFRSLTESLKVDLEITKLRFKNLC